MSVIVTTAHELLDQWTHPVLLQEADILLITSEDLAALLHCTASLPQALAAVHGSQ
jgi:hypothetical protein